MSPSKKTALTQFVSVSVAATFSVGSLVSCQSQTFRMTARICSFESAGCVVAPPAPNRTISIARLSPIERCTAFLQGLSQQLVRYGYLQRRRNARRKLRHILIPILIAAEIPA